MILYIPYYEKGYNIQAIANPVFDSNEAATIMTLKLVKALPGYRTYLNNNISNRMFEKNTAMLWKGKKVNVLSMIYEHKSSSTETIEEFKSILEYIKLYYKNMGLKSILFHPRVWDYICSDDEDARTLIEDILGPIMDLEVYMILDDDRRDESIYLENLFKDLIDGYYIE